jgi:hypothetical protein
MNMLALFFPRGNDVTVTAKFPGITSGTGVSSKFWRKNSKTTSDTDPATISYTSVLTAGTDGIWFATFKVPKADNATPGTFWWRVDAIDPLSNVTTAACGPLLVEAV